MKKKLVIALLCGTLAMCITGTVATYADNEKQNTEMSMEEMRKTPPSISSASTTTENAPAGQESTNGQNMQKHPFDIPDSEPSGREAEQNNVIQFPEDKGDSDNNLIRLPEEDSDINGSNDTTKKNEKFRRHRKFGKMNEEKRYGETKPEFPGKLPGNRKNAMQQPGLENEQSTMMRQDENMNMPDPRKRETEYNIKQEEPGFMPEREKVDISFDEKEQNANAEYPYMNMKE